MKHTPREELLLMAASDCVSSDQFRNYPSMDMMPQEENAIAIQRRGEVIARSKARLARNVAQRLK